ncbi:MAG: HD domain-containing phosphohydrolase [Planctomycetota bacterium]
MESTVATAQGQRVLVIDDTPSVCSLIGQALQAHNLECVLVTQAEQAEQLICTESFGSILCDVNMPEISGLELLQRARQVQRDVPVILMTGHGSVEDAKYAIRQGAYDYLEKPLDVERLHRIVTRAMEERRRAPVASPHDAAADQHDALTGLLTPRMLHERLNQIRLTSVTRRDNCSVIVLDLDQFAEANSIFGYAFGDELLRRVGRALQDLLGDGVPICRFGADEFVIVLTDAHERQAAVVAEQVRHMLARLPVEWQGHAVSITASLGVAEAGAGFSSPPEQVLAGARRAVRDAKRHGGNVVRASIQSGDGASGTAFMAAADLQDMAQEAARIDHQLWLACLEGVRALVSAVEAKDPYTRMHSDHVAYYAEHLGKYTDLPGDLMETIRVAAVVHDVGKIGIPDTILTKPGRLTDEEFQFIREHPRMGAEILSKITILDDESRLVLYHHENWDGSGYPDGLVGEAIPLGARVIQLADCIDAMLMRRTYKEPLPLPQVLEELSKGRGTQFDPVLAEAAIQWLEDHPDRVIQSETEERCA